MVAATQLVPGLSGLCNSMIEEMPLDSEKIRRIKICVAGYTSQDGIGGAISDLFYRIWNAFCSMFGRSDWQLAIDAMDGYKPSSENKNREAALCGTNITPYTMAEVMLNQLIAVNKAGLFAPDELFTKFFVPILIPEIAKASPSLAFLNGDEASIKELGQKVEAFAPLVEDIQIGLDKPNTINNPYVGMAVSMLSGQAHLVKPILAAVVPAFKRIAEQSQTNTLNKASLQKELAALIMLGKGIAKAIFFPEVVNSPAASAGTTPRTVSTAVPTPTSRTATATPSNATANAKTKT